MCEFKCSNAVKVLVDVLWKWSDLSSQLSLNLEHLVLVVISYEIYRKTVSTESATATNSVQIGFSISREVKVYDNINRHNVYASCEKVSADQTAGVSILKVVVNP